MVSTKKAKKPAVVKPAVVKPAVVKPADNKKAPARKATPRKQAPALEASSITLTSEDGHHKLTLAAIEEGVGIWVRAYEDKMAVITSTSNSGPTFALYDGTDDDVVPVVAVYLDDDGTPLIQTRGPGGAAMVNELLPLVRSAPQARSKT